MSGPPCASAKKTCFRLRLAGSEGSEELLLCCCPYCGGSCHDTAGHEHGPRSSCGLEESSRKGAGADSSGHVVLSASVVDDGVNGVVDECCDGDTGKV